MENLTYVTGNYGKYVAVKDAFSKSGIDIHFFSCDLDEANVNDIEFISKGKAQEAFEIVKSPVIVADCGFYIENYPGNPGYPGAFVKRSGVSSDIDKLLEIMKDVDNRGCYFLDCLTFYDGTSFEQFFGKSHGSLAKCKKGNAIKKAKSNLWYVFVPDNCDKTLAEMTDEERDNRPDNRTSATLEFIKWYKEKKNEKVLKKQIKRSV